ncbi:hypothetical protein CHGG_09394 [Chaetomium globosum CBS 148.51]|uniref:AA1-like domain-containing protein n=1 Tax=Chaetomium globosum (strain ATCC 6205 / CBS 148.51 / DSM 1962 / NBRC 6347 / NRRL 1970) TaxID=306901 RepID=Q2GRL0_CHAGB|nr:uncharacterized protein CHGG_09394 [Chaetomium globosum CBS 148.51]EAQ85380.1 hypothetical protein CHGG_09394 [Chaetomium globosum CBS 148.51]
MLPDISLLLLAGVMSADAHALPVVAAAAEAEPTTVGVFLGAKREGEYSFDASVIAADAVATTYQIRCQSGHLNMPGFPTTTCDQNDPPWTVTEGPSTMVGILSTAIASVTAVLDETCVIEDRTAAYCNYTFSGESAGTTTSTAYTTIITGELFTAYPVVITAGAEKLPAATDSPTL